MATQVIGLEELQRRMAGWPEKVQRKVLRQSVLKGLTPIGKEMRRRAPVGKPRTYQGQPIRPGALKRSIGQRFKRRRDTGLIEAKVGANVGRRGPRQAPHAHLVALGTAPRYTKKTQAYRGGTPQDLFVSQSYAASAGNAMRVMVHEVQARLTKELAKRV